MTDPRDERAGLTGPWASNENKVSLVLRRLALVGVQVRNFAGQRCGQP